MPGAADGPRGRAGLAARVAHAACYVAGIQVERTLAYATGLAGTVMILTQLH